MKVLITGYPGTGKSSIAKELQRRGYNAYDTEAMRGYMHAESVKTGRRIRPPSPVPRNWFDDVGNYNWDIPRITALLNSHDDVFICALADNQESLYDLFDTIFLLTIDEVEMDRRLRSRTTSDYGKNPGELADILMNHLHFEQSSLERGAIAIDVKPGLPEVVDQILKRLQEV